MILNFANATNLCFTIHDSINPVDRKKLVEDNLIRFYELTKQERIFYVVILVNNYGSTYTLQFLLCAPELWFDFDINDWECLLQISCDEGKYVLLNLVCKYICIDPFKSFFKMSKTNVIDPYIRDLVYDEPLDFEEDYFTSGVLADIDFFHTASQRLISQGAVSTPSTIQHIFW